MLTAAGSVCVTACPNSSSIDTYSNATCIGNITPTLVTYTSLIASGQCAAYTYKSGPVYSICIPDVTTITTAMIALSPSSGNSTSSSSANNILSTVVGSSAQIMSDLKQTWPVLAVSAGAGLVLSFMWLFVIQWFGTIFVWVVLLAFNAVFIGGAVWLYFYWQTAIGVANNSALSIDNYEVTAAFSAFIAVSVIGGIFLLVTIAMIKKIRLAIQILKEATSAVRAMPFIGNFS